jgi:hypothetical protein
MKRACNVGTIKGTFGIIQGTFGIIQGTFGIIQGTFGINHGTFGIIQGTFGINHGTFGISQVTNTQANQFRRCKAVSYGVLAHGMVARGLHSMTGGSVVR